MEEDCLIFLISQPRAGSTLLQRMLGSHSQIHTTAEPWVMLHPLFALRDDGHWACYNARLAKAATNLFLEGLDQGKAVYTHALREFGLRLYGKALSGTGKKFFLDKTPRYYLIVRNLLEVFPRAHFIILFRNPIAVLASSYSYFVRNHGKRLSDHRIDLLDAPKMLLEGSKVLGDKSIVVNYEQLVSSPEETLVDLCRKLGIEFQPSMVEYGNANLPHWPLGDQGKVYLEGKPVVTSLDAWKKDVQDPGFWKLAWDYLRFLGPEIVSAMGYSFEAIQLLLKQNRPSWLRLIFRPSLASSLRGLGPFE